MMTTGDLPGREVWPAEACRYPSRCDGGIALVSETWFGTIRVSALHRWIDFRLKERDMIATHPRDSYAAALVKDATAMIARVGLGTPIGRSRLCDMVHEYFLVELLVVLQFVRWLEIRLVKPGDIDLPPISLLMIDLRSRIAASPLRYTPSFMMNGTRARMEAWWRRNTLASAWRSVDGHFRVRGTPPVDIAAALADFLWESRGAPSATANRVGTSESPGRTP